MVNKLFGKFKLLYKKKKPRILNNFKIFLRRHAMLIKAKTKIEDTINSTYSTIKTNPIRLILILLTVIVIAILSKSNINTLHEMNIASITPVIAPISKTSLVVNRLADIPIFSPPIPPGNHDSIITLLHKGVPLTKYIATKEAIPEGWVTYTTEAITFRHPSDYYILPISHQRILFFDSQENLDKGEQCFSKYDYFLGDECPTPILVLYYAAIQKGMLEMETSYFGGNFHSVASFYAIDSREWLVSRLWEDARNESVIAQTATEKKIVELKMVAYYPDIFSPKEKAPHGENFATEVFKVFSTISILNDNQITNYKVENPDIQSSYEITIMDLSKNGSKTNLITLASGLDYLPDPDRRISLYYPTDTNPYPADGDEFVFHFTFPQGLIREGSYSFEGMRFNIRNKNDLLVPYLKNDKYCQVDSECSFADHYCGVGFYNKYREFYSVWGCESPTYDEKGRFLDEFDKEYQCIIDLKFDGVSCINNSCTGINQRYVCK